MGTSLPSSTGTSDPTSQRRPRRGGHLGGNSLAPEPISQSGSVDLELALQEGRDEWSPVPTLPPVAPDAVESHSYTGASPDVLLDEVTITHVTPTPDPNASVSRRSPLGASVSWTA